MGQVRVADLPSTDNIAKENYVIIEKPGQGDGTFKSTVSDLQKAITVTAKVEQVENVTKILIDDINGHTEGQVVAPTARIRDNKDNTVTLTVMDASGTQSITLLRDSRIPDSEPTEFSNNILTSGTLYNEFQKIKQSSETSTADLLAKIEELDNKTSEQFNTVTAHLTTIDSKLDEIDERLDEHDTSISILTESLSDLTDRVELIEANAILPYSTGLTDESGNILLTEYPAGIYTDKTGTIWEMRQEDGIPNVSFSTDAGYFDTLYDAIMGATDGYVKLIGDGFSSGISIPEGHDFVLDLNGHELSMTGPGAGSKGTETNGMQLLKDSNITIKNGTITFSDAALKKGIQNYSNLTLDNVKINGGTSIEYVVSNNYGNIVFKNSTEIHATYGNVAFDCWYGMSSAYDSGVRITIEDTSVVVDGKVEFGKASRASKQSFAVNAGITCPESMSVAVTPLTVPCEWISNGDGTKTYKYIYAS